MLLDIADHAMSMSVDAEMMCSPKHFFFYNFSVLDEKYECPKTSPRCAGNIKCVLKITLARHLSISISIKTGIWEEQLAWLFSKVNKIGISIHVQFI